MDCRITYDPAADAAYIYLRGPIGRGEVAKTEIADVDILSGSVNLDFDGAGKLIGIELLGAKSFVSDDVLQTWVD